MKGQCLKGLGGEEAVPPPSSKTGRLGKELSGMMSATLSTNACLLSLPPLSGLMSPFWSRRSMMRGETDNSSRSPFS